MRIVRRIVLVSCVKTKLGRPARAAELYASPLFKLLHAYGRSLRPDAIYILSAKHGLLSEDEVIEPYEQALKSMSRVETAAWGERVIEALALRCDLENDIFTLLAGVAYRKPIEGKLGHRIVPLDGLSFGRQLQWLSARV